MTNYIIRYIFLLLMLLPLDASAQFNMLFTSDNELPNSLVNKVVVDSRGMLWIATEDGLCMYNGSRFIVYTNIASNPNSLAADFVRTVYTDSKGDVLVGTIAGLQAYRPLTGDFTPVLTNSADGIVAGNINDLNMMHDGSFIVGGNQCFSLTHDNDGWHVRKNVITDKIPDIHRVIETKDGSIFLGRLTEGVLRVDKRGAVQKISDDNGRVCNIAAFCVAGDGHLYAGSADAGLYVYNAGKHRLHLIPGTEHIKHICDIKCMPQSNMLCIATDGIGVQMFDTRSQRCVSSQHLSSSMVDLSTQKAHSLYIGKNGDIWVGLYQKGVYMTTSQKIAFTNIGQRSLLYDFIGSHCVTSLLQTHDGNIWVTTDNGGLYGFTSSLTSLHQYPTNNLPNGVPPTMLGLFEDSQHRVWYGSYGHGGGTADLSSGSCHCVHIDGNTNTDFHIFSYTEDKRGQVWAASMGDGILRYDESRKVFIHYINKDPLQWSDAIFYDRQHDRLYCGTYNGIVSFSPADKTKTTTAILSDYVVYSISRVSADELAFATNKGLVLLTLSNGKTRLITKAQGLPNNNVCAAQSSGDGCVWVSTMSGLTRFNLKTMNAETYTIRDGLQGNEFYKSASIVTRDGRLWFGGTNGITSFLPRDVNRSSIRCKVRVVDVRAGEVYLVAGEEGDFDIPSGVNSFTVSFATLPLFMSHRVTYSYRMDGGDWEILSAPQNRIAFDNLGYGSHTLQVKTTIDGKDSEISETEIYIHYPWYLKWWMVIIWLALLAVLAYYLYVSVQRRRHIRERLRRTQQEQEIKETKLQFFMNIVHDLRTPLTLIATPLQKLQKSDTDASRQHLYSIMSRNTDRLLNLTNEIMDLRKLDSGKMELVPHRALISKVIRDIVDNMEDIAHTRHQQLVLTDNTDGRQFMMIDAQAFEKILTNLLSNAVKYTPEGGQIEVEWNIDNANQSSSSLSSSSTLIISVTDNGIGIADEEKKRIFERFYQVRINDKHIKGTGIGLDLVKSLVELHNGDITVTDNPAGKGTRFTVVIPSQTAANGEDSEAVPEAPEVIPEYPEASTTVPSAPATVPSGSPEGPEVASSKNRHTILIVDDDDDIREFLMEELSGVFNVLEAPNGKVAYEILNRTYSASTGKSGAAPVELVISDVMMPEVDGIELIRMIRKNVLLTHLPIILLTAKTSEQDYMEGFQATADAYVAKPFNMELLETFICNLLIRQDKLRKTFSGNVLPSGRIDTPEVTSADDKLMERLLKTINDNLSNPDLTSEMLAREVGLSRVHMYRKLKELTNQSATNYIRNIRLTKAAELLREGKSTISEVAYLVGFRSPAHFSAAFKTLYGVSPKEYISQTL